MKISCYWEKNSFCFILFYLFKTVRHIVLLETGICCKFRKQNRWTFMALSKFDGSVSLACCQYPVGKVGTCSHMFAVMKLVEKWTIDELTKIQEIKACNSKLCTWSLPQSRGKLFKHPISEISLISPASKKQKTIDENATPKGIKSSLYDACIESKRV